MLKIVKRMLVSILVIILLLAGAGWWLTSYIAPERELNLEYEEVNIEGKVLDMAKRMRPELVLTEQDMNNLAKMVLAQSGGKIEAEGEAAHIEITGASFELKGEELHAHLNVLYRERIAAELTALYTLSWKAPNLILEPQQLAVKGIDLPSTLLERQEIEISVPKKLLVNIRDVRFEDGQMVIRFKLAL